MLHNAENKGHDITKIIEGIKHNETLEQQISQKESRLERLNSTIHKTIKKQGQLDLKYENLQLRHKSMQETVRSVDVLKRKGVKPESILTWAKIFESAGLDEGKFTDNLKEHASMEKLISAQEQKKTKLGQDIVALQKKKSWLESKKNDLKREISNWTEFGKNNLKKITSTYESQINSTSATSEHSIREFMRESRADIGSLKKQITGYFEKTMLEIFEVLEKSHKIEHTLGKMESLKPLFDLINGRFDPIPSITQTVVILDRLQIEIKNADMDKHFIASDIRRLREKLIDMISNER